MRKKLLNWKVGKKLSFSFIIVIAVFVVALSSGLFFLFEISSSLTNFYNVPYVNRNAILELRRSMQSASKNILWATTTDSSEETESHLNDAESDFQAVNEQKDILMGNFTNQEMLDAMEAAVNSLQELAKQAIEYAGSNKNTEALALYNGEFSEVLKEVQETTNAIAEFASNKASTDFDKATMMRNAAFIIVIVLSVLSILLAVYLAMLLTKGLTKPIDELKMAANSLSKGELDIDIEYQSKDELGELATGFRNTCEGLKLIINDLGLILEQLARQNLNVRTTCEERYVGAFAPLLLNLRETFRELSSTVEHINDSAEQVSLGSTQMAQSAQALAEGATEQAGSVEELQATITDMSEQIEANAQEIRRVDERAVQVGDEVENSSREMGRMTAAMGRIQENSRQIGDIIGDIEDIASQTNLLSLNAAIEAARAGEAGKGFAVVADQIRKLADESAQSAVNTKELIETSIKEVENGNEIAKKTADSLTSVIDGIQEIKESIGLITNASESQAESAKQVVQGVDQISSVVQTNSATAEETSATSEELSAQAATLSGLVSTFELRKE